MRDELVFARLGPGVRTIGYAAAWELQRHVHQQRVAGLIPDTCLLLEHEAVYTAGKRTTPLDRPAGDPGAPVIDVDRGGNITWHGPGQLVGYPVVALGDPIDVVAYVHAIEEALIGVCREFGLAAGRVAGRRGVWVSGGGRDRKVAAIGVRVARGVTMHGFALNCDCDLSWYDRIVPCGIPDASVTSLSVEAGRQITVTEVLPAVQRHLAAALGAGSVRAVDGLPVLAPVAAAG